MIVMLGAQKRDFHKLVFKIAYTVRFLRRTSLFNSMANRKP